MSDSKTGNLTTRLRFFVASYFVVALAAISYLPTLIPGKFVASSSYIFGYNNHAGVALIFIFAAIGALWSQKLGLPFIPRINSTRVRTNVLWLSIAVVGLLSLGMYFLTEKAGYYGESAYLINRIELASHGLRPYRDFEYAYGASFVYLPLLLSRLLHITISDAYYLFWFFNLVGGIWLLSEVVRRVDYPSPHKNEIFLLLYGFMLTEIISTGLNYTWFRFALAPFFSLLIFEVIQADAALITSTETAIPASISGIYQQPISPKGPGLARQAYGSFLVVVFTLLLLLVSPEIGVAFALGISTYMLFFYSGVREKSWILPYGSMLLAICFELFLANKFQVFDTLKAFGSGGFNFPIIPVAPPILFFLSSLFLSAAYIFFTLSMKIFRTSTMCVLMVTLPELPAAFGRCDPGHLIFYGFGIVLVGLLYISNHSRIWRWYRAAFIIIFIVGGLIVSLWLNSAGMARSAIELIFSSQKQSGSVLEKTANHLLVWHFGEALADEKISKLKAESRGSVDNPRTPSQIQGIAEAPFGYVATRSTTDVDWGYYFAELNVSEGKAVAEKVAELQAHPTRMLLLPDHYEKSCSIDPMVERIEISFLFLYPYSARVVHPASIYGPICSYIDSNYLQIAPPQASTYGYGIWVRKQLPTPM